MGNKKKKKKSKIAWIVTVILAVFTVISGFHDGIELLNGIKNFFSDETEETQETKETIYETPAPVTDNSSNTENQIAETYITQQDSTEMTGVVLFSLTLPSNASGRFVLDFLDSNGETIAYSSTINAAFSNGIVNTPVEGSGVQQIVVILSNYTTNQQAELGVYNFDFPNKNYSIVRESVTAAFEAVGGINHPSEALSPQESEYELDTIPDPLA